MTEYIDKAQAAAEITLAYQDGRIGCPEDILGVLDLLPSAGADIAKQRERLKAYEDTGLAPEEVAVLKARQAMSGADQDDEDTVMYAMVKDGNGDRGDVYWTVRGSTESLLVSLAVLISDVAGRMGCDVVSLCRALADHLPTFLSGRGHE